MQATHWQPPVELSASEPAIANRINRAQLFVFLRGIRPELFAEALQHELNQMDQDRGVGQPPVPSAQVAVGMIIQSDTGASDDAGIEGMSLERPSIQVPDGEVNALKIPITSWDTP